MPKKKKGARKAPVKAAPKSAPKSIKGKFGAKAAFVRSHPNASAKEVVDLAAKAGLTMTVNHVYNVRSTSGISRRRTSAPVARAATPSKAGKVVKMNGPAEAQFRRLVLEIGVARARTLLRDIDHKLAAIVAGR